MGRVAILKIKSDEQEQELDVCLQVREDNCSTEAETNWAKLSYHPDINASYVMWRSYFRGLKLRSFDDDDDWGATPSLTAESRFEGEEACKELVKVLEANMQDWLESSNPEWQQIREKLVAELSRHSQEIRIIIQANPSLWKFPWHTWDLLKFYPDICISFSLEKYEKVDVAPGISNNDQVKILAVFGDDRNINLQPDWEAIKNLPGAAPEKMFQPTAQQLIRKLREGSWDILFFAGHSETKNKTGKIFINETEYLEIADFKNALREAIRKGLKIAIFNSCEGQGLAEAIAKLHIPTVIFMQEKVPDTVAQSFVEEFLREYASGESLNTSFRRAQGRLEEFTQLPGATLLPKLCQNPAEVPLTWEQLRYKKKSEDCLIPPPPPPPQPKIQTGLITSLIVTILMMGMRSLSLFQSLELQAYDRLMQQRPAEAPDSRLLIIGADEQDIRKYNYPLPDAILAQILAKIGQHQPQVIGLTIYRDLPVNPGHAAMVAQLQKNKKLITACKFISEKEGVNPPPKSPTEQVGFNNLLLDPVDYKVRRHLLYRSPNPISKFDRCKTSHSFSFQLAFQYLHAKHFPVRTTDTEEWQFGKIIFKRLNAHNGGYQKIDARGYQFLLNYRATPEIAQKVTVRDILSNRFEPSWVKDKIVLIGMTAESVPSSYNTAYGKMQAVDIYAHMVSEVISAVEDRRPLIWWLPLWGDGIWIWLWSFAGGIIILFVRSPIYLCLGISISLAILYGLCWGFFLQGCWLPLIPAGLALLTSGITLLIYPSWKTQSN